MSDFVGVVGLRLSSFGYVFGGSVLVWMCGEL